MAAGDRTMQSVPVNSADEPIPLAHEFTATARTASEMARAFVIHQHRRRVVAIYYLGAFITMSAVLLAGFTDGYSGGGRIAVAAIWGGAVTVLAAGGMATLMFVLTRRNTRSTAYEGAVMRTGFGDNAFVTENPLSSTRFAYDAVESISTYGGFVFVRYVGSLMLRVYPTQVFPSEIVQRLKTDIDNRSPARRR